MVLGVGVAGGFLRSSEEMRHQRQGCLPSSGKNIIYDMYVYCRLSYPLLPDSPYIAHKNSITAEKDLDIFFSAEIILPCFNLLRMFVIFTSIFLIPVC